MLIVHTFRLSSCLSTLSQVLQSFWPVEHLQIKHREQCGNLWKNKTLLATASNQPIQIRPTLWRTFYHLLGHHRIELKRWGTLAWLLTLHSLLSSPHLIPAQESLALFPRTSLALGLRDSVTSLRESSAMRPLSTWAGGCPSQALQLTNENDIKRPRWFVQIHEEVELAQKRVILIY